MFYKIKSWFKKQKQNVLTEHAIQNLTDKYNSLNDDILELNEELAKIKGLLIKLSEKQCIKK
jgi:predicted  nucleic acid-binding Zn-ribbon protein